MGMAVGKSQNHGSLPAASVLEVGFEGWQANRNGQKAGRFWEITGWDIRVQLRRRLFVF